jgi:predicted amidohydrolase
MSPAAEVRIRCHELAPAIGDLKANLSLIREAIVGAADAGVQLLILPELATSGYYLRDHTEARASSISAQHPVFAEWAGLLASAPVPGGMTLVVGFAETESDGNSNSNSGPIFNSAAIVTASGVAAVYRKTHLWGAEPDIFSPGHEAPPVIDTPVGRLGVLVCYDIEFPEMPRSLALAGAEIIAVPTNWPASPYPAGEHPPELAQAMAAARASCLVIACCDRSGSERGYDWVQGTGIAGADGWLLGEKDGEGRVDAVVTISPTAAQWGARNNAIADRRPDLYSSRLTGQA